VKSKSG